MSDNSTDEYDDSNPNQQIVLERFWKEIQGR